MNTVQCDCALRTRRLHRLGCPNRWGTEIRLDYPKGRVGVSNVHVLPHNDLINHGPTGDGFDCPCGPTTETVKRDDGSIGWVVVHHSLDGREQGE